MESSVLSVYMVSSDSLALIQVQGIAGPEGSRGLNCVMEVSGVNVWVCVATEQMRKGKYGILCSLGPYAGPRYHWSNGTKVSVVSEQIPQDNKWPPYSGSSSGLFLIQK